MKGWRSGWIPGKIYPIAFAFISIPSAWLTQDLRPCPKMFCPHLGYIKAHTVVPWKIYFIWKSVILIKMYFASRILTYFYLTTRGKIICAVYKHLKEPYKSGFWCDYTVNLQWTTTNIFPEHKTMDIKGDVKLLSKHMTVTHLNFLFQVSSYYFRGDRLPGLSPLQHLFFLNVHESIFLDHCKTYKTQCCYTENTHTDTLLEQMCLTLRHQWGKKTYRTVQEIGPSHQ